MNRLAIAVIMCVWAFMVWCPAVKSLYDQYKHRDIGFRAYLFGYWTEYKQGWADMFRMFRNNDPVFY